MAMDMRVGATFAEAAETIILDHAAYQEAMATAANQSRKRPNSTADSPTQPNRAEATGGAEDKSAAKTPHRRRRPKRKAQPKKHEDSKGQGKEADKEGKKTWWTSNDGKSTGWNTWRKADAKR